MNESKNESKIKRKTMRQYLFQSIGGDNSEKGSKGKVLQIYFTVEEK